MITLKDYQNLEESNDPNSNNPSTLDIYYSSDIFTFTNFQ